MKRILSAILCIALIALLLTACGNANESHKLTSKELLAMIDKEPI